MLLGLMKINDRYHAEADTFNDNISEALQCRPTMLYGQEISMQRCGRSEMNPKNH